MKLMVIIDTHIMTNQTKPFQFFIYSDFLVSLRVIVYSTVKSVHVLQGFNSKSESVL